MQPSHTSQPGREPFLVLGEAMLERVRSVARRIVERVRLVADDVGQDHADPPRGRLHSEEDVGPRPE